MAPLSHGWRGLLVLGTLCTVPVLAADPTPAPAAPPPSATATNAPAAAPAPAQIPAPAPVPSGPSADETRGLKDLQDLVDDGLFEKTDTAAKAFLQKFPASPLRAQARLLQGKALYYLGRFAPAADALKGAPKDLPDALAPEFLFWQGEVYAALENWPEAEKAYRACLAQAGASSPLAPKAQLGLAWTLAKQGNEADARALLAALMQATPPVEAGEKAALVLAKIQIADSQLDEAVKTLDALGQRKVRPAAAFEAAYWRGEIAQLRKDWPTAIKYYRVVTDDPKAFPGPLVAQAWFGLGSVYGKDGNPADGAQAMQALEQAFTLGTSEQVRLASFRLYLQAAAALQRLPQAQAKLRDFAQKDKSPVTAGAALLAIAASQADNGAADQAVGTLEALLTTSPQTDWRAAALFQLGQLYTDKGKPDQALAAFQNCLDSGPAPAMAREAEYKTAEIWFAKGDAAKAADFFQKAAAGAPNNPVAEKALVNLLRCQAQLGNVDAFLKTEADFDKAFPQSGFLGRIVLEKAGLYEKAGQADKARAVYQDAVKTAAPDQKPLLLLRLADLLSRGGQYDDAFALYNQILNDFKEDARVPEAAYGAIWTGNLAGHATREQARDQLLQLAQRFPQSPLAPTMVFEAATFYYDQQDYVDAQTKFEQAAKLAQGPLASRALYYAGDSALHRSDFQAALQILEKIPENAPDNLKTEARLLQGLVYQRQAKFENALALFDAVLSTEKTGRLFVAATLRKGDCLFALGGGDPTRYEQAASAYGTLLAAGQGDFAQRNEAATMRAQCWEKLGRTDDALNLYLDVLNGREAPAPAPTEGNGGTAPAAPPPDLFWRVKAGLFAADLRKQQQNWRGMVDIYQRLESLGGATQAEFRDTATRLRREHFLFDDSDLGDAAAVPATNVPVATPPPAAVAPANAATNAVTAAPAKP